ncbi:DUF6164 family protein [Alloalcanivorax xenomutans]|uniref:DUF6164 family protein n=1 Tax=Alloalcanivorax xenomutans TaxID=1094342 RepID=UPI0029346BCE|nr:DUF6164 family protein [Alloalcanivorax xenomutans]WOD29455.1 DUF6164 family protein [Alloalcanivorax xenomutans]
MTTLLLNLRRVPDDEADEVRALLERHDIPFYETTPSLWGVSAGGIWLTRPEDRQRAQALMAEYQQERGQRQRAAYEEARRLGTAPTLWRRLREQPVQALAMLLAVIALLLITLLPFLTF